MLKDRLDLQVKMHEDVLKHGSTDIDRAFTRGYITALRLVLEYITKEESKDERSVKSLSKNPSSGSISPCRLLDRQS